MNDTEQTLADKLNLVRGSREHQVVEPDEFEEELIDDDGGYRAFLVSRQAMGRAEMLNLKFKNGTHESLEYSHLYRIRFQPADGTITLEFSDHEVTVRGMRLMNGYRRLLTHRVIQLAEADTPTAKLTIANEKEPVITEIVVTNRVASS